MWHRIFFDTYKDAWICLIQFVVIANKHVHGFDKTWTVLETL